MPNTGHGFATAAGVTSRILTRALMEAPSPRERLRVLLEDWGFRIAMASAVLTVLWPDKFTVYDVRVCDELGRFGNLSHLTRFASIWKGYQRYLEAVREAVPAGLPLRDADRYLWGRSAAHQLVRDIERGFGIGTT